MCRVLPLLLSSLAGCTVLFEPGDGPSGDDCENNLLEDPGFESGTFYWEADGASMTFEPGRRGNALRIDPQMIPSSIRIEIPAMEARKPGETYSFSAWIRCTNEQAPLDVELLLVQDLDAPEPNHTMDHDITSLPGCETYHRFAVELTMQKAPAEDAMPVIGLDDDHEAGAILVDDVCYRRLP